MSCTCILFSSWSNGTPPMIEFIDLSLISSSEVESSRTSLASRIHFWSPWPRRSSPWPRGLKYSKIGLSSGSRTALFFDLLKFCGALEKFFGKRFFVEIAWKIFVKTLFIYLFFFFFWRSPEKFLWGPVFFFWRGTCACVLGPWPWPRAFLYLASRVSVLGKAVLGPWIFFVSLASSLVSSTPPLIIIHAFAWYWKPSL